jgi:hypothetical protein
MATSLTEIVVTIVLGVAASLVAAEINAYSPHITRGLIRLAARKLLECDRERFTEEWLAHADELPGSFAKVRHGIGCYLKAANSIRKYRFHLSWVRRILGAFATAYAWFRISDYVFPMLVKLIRSGQWSTAFAYFLSNRSLVKTLVLERIYRRSDDATVDAAVIASVKNIRKVLGVDVEELVASQDEPLLK